jgi:hypothetical protein
MPVTIPTDALLEAARWAPSLYNTQPWRFRPLPDAWEVRWDPDSELPVADPQRVALMMNLGAVIEYLAVAASAYGLDLQFVPPEFKGTQPNLGFIAGKIQFFPRAGAPSPLVPYLQTRQTSRKPYRSAPLPAGVLDELQAAAASAGCWLFHTTDRGAIAGIAGEAARGTLVQFDEPERYAEFHRWLRSAKAEDGLDVPSLDLAGTWGGLWQRVLPPSRMVRMKLAQRALAAQQRSLVQSAPAICMLATNSREWKGWIQAGRALSRVWLHAARHGLVTHPVPSALHTPEGRRLVSERLGVEGDLQVSCLFRLGESAPAPRSGRLEAERLLV